jgi:synaptobrevin family protein YKT6
MAQAEEPFKLLSCMIFAHDEKKPTTLSVCYLTDEFSFWTRGGVQQASMFISRVCVARTELGKIQTIIPEGKEFDPDTVLTDYYCHVMVKSNKLSLAVVTSKNYPRRVAFEVMQDLSKKWEEVHPNWASLATGVDKTIEFPYMTKICKSYEDPRKSDNILKIQNQLDETRDIMVQNIESILARGETIQELVDKTDDLEMSSKVFFQNADKLNSCWGRCTIL